MDISKTRIQLNISSVKEVPTGTPFQVEVQGDLKGAQLVAALVDERMLLEGYEPQDVEQKLR